MKTECIKSDLEKIKNSYVLTYNDIKTVLDDLIIDENKRRQSNQYTIDLEGDFVFKNGHLFIQLRESPVDRCSIRVLFSGRSTRDIRLHPVFPNLLC